MKMTRTLLFIPVLLLLGTLTAFSLLFDADQFDSEWKGVPFVVSEPLVTESLAPMPGFPLEKGFAVASCFSGAGTDNSAVTQDPTGFVLGVFDIQDPVGEGAPSGETNWDVGGANAFHGVGDSWTAANLGELFGIAIDVETQPNVYVTASGLTKYSNGFSSLTPGSLGGAGTGGEIYKINGATGAISRLASLPNSMYQVSGVIRYVGLGQIDYNFRAGVLYVSNLDDGLIYVLNATTGAQIATFDHGLLGRVVDGQLASADNPLAPFTGIDRMVHGLGYSRVDNRLYYAVPKDNDITTNQVWSIGINENGSLNQADITKEFELAPALNLATFLLPPPPDPPIEVPTPSLITDISFGSDANKMLIAEMSLFSTS